MQHDKQTIINALRAFIEQRPGLEWANYGHAPSYRADARMITQQLHDASAMLAYIDRAGSISADDIIRAASHRLTIETMPDGSARVDYCTGQYWPVEYRAAVARLCSDVLWAQARDIDGLNLPGIQSRARRLFGRGIATRWFR